LAEHILWLIATYMEAAALSIELFQDHKSQWLTTPHIIIATCFCWLRYISYLQSSAAVFPPANKTSTSTLILVYLLIAVDPFSSLC